MLEIAQIRKDWTEAVRLIDQLSSASQDTGQTSDEALRRLRFHSLIEAGRIDEAQALWPEHLRLRQNNMELQGLHLCQACAFQTQRHYWQCPGCMNWDSLKSLGQDQMVGAKA